MHLYTLGHLWECICSCPVERPGVYCCGDLAPVVKLNNVFAPPPKEQNLDMFGQIVIILYFVGFL